MNKYITKLFTAKLIISLFFLITSFTASQSPEYVIKTLSAQTKSKYIASTEIDSLLSNKCKYITRNRTYLAPIGLTAKKDIKKGAKGIDEWVTLDGGNAYVLRNYKWVIVDDWGSSQLQLEFDTILCE